MQARQLDVRYDDDDEQVSVDMTTGVVPTVEASPVEKAVDLALPWRCEKEGVTCMPSMTSSAG